MNRGILGYSIGAMSDTGLCAYINSFFLLYLTTVVGINSSIAATIISLSLASEAVFSVVFGRVSDHCQSRFGRRRPFILSFGLMYCVTLYLLFICIRATIAVQIIYYSILGVVMKAAYSAYYTPYVALGSNVARDYDERTRMRSICKLFSSLGNLSGYVLPLILIPYFVEVGLEEETAWSVFTFLLGVIMFIPILITWQFTKEYDPPVYQTEKDRTSFCNMIRSYFDLLKIKPMFYFMLFKILFNVSYVFQTNSMLFYMIYKLNLSESITSVTYISMVILSFVSVPFINTMGIRFGKSDTCKYIFLFSGFGGLVLYYIGIHNLIQAVVYVIIYYLSNCAFWQICYSMLYDICDADELCFSKRREGDIMSFQSLIPTIFSAFATQVLGLILSAAEFQPAANVQNGTVLFSLDLLFIIIPCGALILSAFILQYYPLKKDTHQKVQTLLSLKSINQNDEELEKMLKGLLLF